MKSVSVLPLLLFLSACSSELDQKSAPDPRVKQLSVEQITTAVTPLEGYNQYQVELKWPKALGHVRVSEGLKVLSVQSASDEKFVQPTSGGRELSYLVEQVSDEGRIIASLPISVKLPQDLLWDQSLEIKDSQKIEVERLFISSKAVITTKDHNLTLVVGELVAEGGLIQNFPEEDTAPFTQMGRSGGTITIQAKKARGSLQVLLSGQRGGHGKNGMITVPGRHPGCAGTDGASGGNTGNLLVSVEEGGAFNVSSEFRPGLGGEKGVRGSVVGGVPSEVVYPPCDRDNPDGIDGARGNAGQACVRLAASQQYVCR